MLIRFCHSYDRSTEVVDIQSILYLVTIAWMTASPEPRVLICMQAKLLYCTEGWNNYMQPWIIWLSNTEAPCYL